MLVAVLLIAAAAQQPTARDLLPQGMNAPGCALDVRRGGTIVETAVTGSANLENAAPITVDTVFEIGSVSKQFVGAGLAILAEQGRLRMDDPITNIRRVPHTSSCRFIDTVSKRPMLAGRCASATARIQNRYSTCRSRGPGA